MKSLQFDGVLMRHEVKTFVKREYQPNKKGELVMKPLVRPRIDLDDWPAPPKPLHMLYLYVVG